MEKEEEILSLLRQNLEYSKKISKHTDKVRRYILYLEVVNLLKILIVMVPIILAIIYGVPLLRDAWHSYELMIDKINDPTGAVGEEIFKFLK